MSQFTKFNAIRPIPKENLWITTEELVFYENDDLTWEKYIVPVGFKFDWASIPRILWVLFAPVEPKTISSAALHDFLVRTKICWYRKTNCLFYKALRTSNWILKSSIFYIWVTLGTWIFYYFRK